MRYSKSLTVLDCGSIVYSGSVRDAAAAASDALKVGHLGRASPCIADQGTSILVKLKISKPINLIFTPEKELNDDTN